MSRSVAIIGYACRLPGAEGAGLWDALCAGRDLVTQVDASRWEKDGFLHPLKGHPGASYTFAAGSIGDVTGFDAGFFGISPREAAMMDPQQRLLLELAWEAIEHAGIPPSTLRGSNCGVYLGISSSDYAYRLADDLAAVASTTATGNTISIAANRISYLFDLHGPSMAIDTACSSSLVAFNQACQAIVAGEADCALTGGISLHLHPYGFLIFAQASMLSPRGRCNPFDAAADGYVRSEGGGLFLLKEYEQAVADGNPILAVVAASGVNTDGRKSGLTVPCAEAQAALIEQVCCQAGLQPAAIDYFEAHGTGTPVGDPIEARALGKALGQYRSQERPLPIGSIKSNLGHLEAAAGVAGLVKALLSLQHRLVPATIGVTTLNPAIDFKGLNLQVVTENLPLNQEGPLHIGINSFGFGGANAHVILQSAPVPPPSPSVADQPVTVPLVVSARDAVALKTAARNMADLLASQPHQRLYHIASSALYRRDLHSQRAVLFGSDSQALAEELRMFANDQPVGRLEAGVVLKNPSGPAFIYGGNGSQWEGMGNGLLKDQVFIAAVKEVDGHFRQYADYSLLDELEGRNGTGRYRYTEIAQPALFAVQVGITCMLRQLGIEPVVVAGHSVGEIAAAWACGALSLPEAVMVIYQRSRLQGLTRGMGQMTAVSVSTIQAAELLAQLALPSLALAGCNSPTGVTMAGAVGDLEQLEAELARQAIPFKRLDLEYAFHSPAMNSIEVELQRVLAKLVPRQSSLPFYSTVTGGLLAGDQLDADYWWRNIREPVLFEQAVSELLRSGVNLFASVSPHPILRSYLNENMRAHDSEGAVITTLTRNNDDPLLVQKAAARLLIAGATPNRQSLFPEPGQLVGLPAYPWQRESLWHPITAESHGVLARRREHPLLGYRLRQHEATWEHQLDTSLMPYLADHTVSGAIVFPATGFLELALAAALALRPTQVVEIEQLEIRAPLLLEKETSRLIRVAVAPDSGRLEITGRDLLSESPLTLHGVARIIPSPWSGALDCAVFVAPVRPPDFDARSHGLLTRRAGLQYGPAFQAIAHGWVEGKRAAAVLLTPAELQAELDGYHLHPVFLDNALQLVFQIMVADRPVPEGMTYLPVVAERVRYLPGHTAPRFATATLTAQAPHSLTADVALYDVNGRPLVEVRQVRFRQARLQRQGLDMVRFPAYRRIPQPLPGRLVQPPSRLAELVAAAVASAHQQAVADRSLAGFVNELDPLLESLCSRFCAEALQDAVADGMSLDHPQLQELVALAEADGLLQRTDDGLQVAVDADADAVSARLLWQGLVCQYPEQVALLQRMGQIGLGLRHQNRQQPAQRPQVSLLAQVLGTSGRRIVGRAVGQLVSHLQQELAAGERLVVLELAEDRPLWFDHIGSVLDAGRSDYHIACGSSDVLDHADQQLESYCSITQHALEQLPVCLAGTAQLAVVSCDFSSQQSAMQALVVAARTVAPGGYLLMAGMHPVRWADFFADGQVFWQQPADWWCKRLQESGFVAARQHDLSSVSGTGPWLMTAQRQVAVVAADHQPDKRQRTLLLVDHLPGLSVQLGDRITAAAAERGEQVLHLAFEGSSPCGNQLQHVMAAPADLRGILFLSGLTADAADETYPERLAAVCAVASTLALAGEQAQLQVPIWIVTSFAAADLDEWSGGDVGLTAIADAPLWAFGRTMMNEYAGLDLRLICLEAGGADTAVAALLDELRWSDGEQEVILAADGARYLPRLVLESAPHEQAPRNYDPEQSTVRLGFPLPGQLRNLRWGQCLRTAPVEDQLEIEVHATGLNFRDIMYTLGLLSDEAVENGFAGATLGLECAGVVTKTGPAVSGFAPGDRVVAFGPASFGTRALTRVSAASHIPAGLSFEAAATIPATFFTAWYSLCHLARLQPGEKVLIHGAAGGVGLAAIQIVQWCGAEVYATAGSHAKRDFLRLLGVQHVYDSRSLDFADLILQDTGNSGVDLVLNSLATEAINRNLRVLKPFGRFLELGKRDFYENTRIGLRPFRNNISYHGVDADQVMQLQPELTRRLFGEIMALFEQGVFHPLPYTCFEADRVVDAFRYMQQSQQIGKVVVTYANGIRQVEPAELATRPTLSFSGDATWLVTGGLGGFGLRTAQWLVEKGVRNLVLISRSGLATAEAQTAVNALQQQGVRIHAAACDVTDQEALHQLLLTIGRELPPLKGIVHAATVIEDGLLRTMGVPQLQRVLAPKILGARHLHELTAHCKLDYFVLFSSATTLFGNPGQGNYVAANSWLEALARLRRANGLPATAVRWGAIDDVGFLARNQNIKESLQKRMGGAALQSEVALAVLEQLLLADCSGLGVLELDWPSLRRFLPSAGHGRFAGLSALYGEDGGAELQGDLLRLAVELPDNELQELISGMLQQEVGQILRIQPDKIEVDRSLYEMGLDSLMGVELVTALESRFGIQLPVMALTEGPTITKLTIRVIGHLRGGEQPDDQGQLHSRAAQAASVHAADLPAEALEELVADISATVARTDRMID